MSEKFCSMFTSQLKECMHHPNIEKSAFMLKHYNQKEIEEEECIQKINSYDFSEPDDNLYEIIQE